MSPRTTLPDRLRKPWAWIVAVIGLVCLVLVVFFAKRVFPGRRTEPVVLASATPHGEYARFGATLEAVVNAHQDRFPLEHRTTSGSMENVKLLAERRVDFAIVQSDTPIPAAVRAVASLFPEPYHLIAARSSGVASVEELKGLRVAVMPNLLGTNGDHGFFDRLLERYGLSRADLAAVTPLTLGSCAAQVDAGEVDAAFLAIALGNESVGEFLRDHDVKLVPIDVHAIEAWHPYVREATIHRGTYWGHPPVPSWDVPSAAVEALLLTHDRVPEDIVRELTKRLTEHRNELLRETPHAVTIRDPESGRYLGIPMHPGARAWYGRGEPGFVIQYAEVIALVMSIGGVFITGLWQLRRRIVESQRDRAEAYNLEMQLLLERAQVVADREQLDALTREALNIFRRVLEDLDHGRISGESFRLFAVPCGLVMDALRHRELLLARNEETDRD